MWLSTFLLTTCVSISGCNHSALANTIEAIKEETDHILLQASEFDYSDYDFTFEEHEEITKQALYEYAKNNDLLSELNDKISENNSVINSEAMGYISDASLTLDGADELISSVNEMNVLQGLEDVNMNLGNISNLLETNSGSLSISSGINETTLSNFSDGHQLGNTNNGNNTQVITPGLSNGSSSGSDSASDGDLSFANNIGSGKSSSSNNSTDSSNLEENEENDYILPILDNNLNAATIQTSGYVDGKYFIGIIASKEACIAVYNAFASFVNSNMIAATGGITVTGVFIEVYKILTSTGIISLSSREKVSVITSFLSPIWKSYIALFKAGALGIFYGIIIAVLVVIVLVGIITVICAMIYFGSKGKGFAAGFRMVKWYYWPWYFDELI